MHKSGRGTVSIPFLILGILSALKGISISWHSQEGTGIVFRVVLTLSSSIYESVCYMFGSDIGTNLRMIGEKCQFFAMTIGSPLTFFAVWGDPDGSAVEFF
jgi:hypothetical protein